MDKTELYDSEDLGLDDVEYFKEYLRFKKSRALLKAKEAQAAAAELTTSEAEKKSPTVDAEKKALADGTAETGSNPPGPAPSLPSVPSVPIEPKVPRLPGFIPVPPAGSFSQKKENGTAVKGDKDPEWVAAANTAAAAVAAAAVSTATSSLLPLGVGKGKAEDEAPLDLDELRRPARPGSKDNKEKNVKNFSSEREKSAEKEKRQEKNRDRTERSDKSREQDARSRRVRSRSRERARRPRRSRSRSRSPRRREPPGSDPHAREPSGREPHGRELSGREPHGREPSGREPPGRDPHGREPYGREPPGRPDVRFSHDLGRSRGSRGYSPRQSPRQPHYHYNNRNEYPNNYTPAGPSNLEPSANWEAMQYGPQWTPNVVELPYLESEEEKARKEGLEKEALQQKLTFINQQKEYLKKRETLTVELGLLKDQRRGLMPNKSNPDVQKIMSENLKLQEEIAVKIKSVDNVLDMLKGLIGDLPEPNEEKPVKEKKKSKKRKRSGSSGSESGDANDDSRDDEKELAQQKLMEEASNKHYRARKRRGSHEGPQRWNYAYYDPEVHWCRPCKVFPSTAKEYLLHLHSEEHRELVQERKLIDLPWHDMNDHKDPVLIPGLQTKRTPIKGLQFFAASTAWFCKLCRSWMGDLHCASLHLKSQEHGENYTDFVTKNPKWEASWLSDRGKAVIASGKKEDILKRQLEEQLLLQKKHEDELKQTTEPSVDLVIPLTLQTKPAPKLAKEKTKKRRKRGRKKKRSKSSESSSSSSSSPSSSTSSSEDEKLKKKKTKKKSKVKEDVPVVKASLPEKSKWEREDSDSEVVNRAVSPDLSHHPILEARKVVSTMRKYRWNEEQHGNRSNKLSPPHVPERHTILIPESSTVKEPPPIKPPAEAPAPVVRPRLREREREEPDDVESRFDKQAEAAIAKKKPPPVLPKTKFAFIGRMPFAKRRNEPAEERVKKEQDVKTPDPTPPPPPVISKKVAPAVQPLPPVLTNKTKVEVAKDILTKSQTALKNRQPAHDVRPVDPVLMEMDMEVEKPQPSPPHIQMPPSPPKIRPPLPPEVTTNLGKKTMNVPLPRDFQEALSIIYPEQPPKPKTPPPPPAPVRVPSPPRIATPPPPPPPPGFGDDFIDFSDVPPAPSPPRTFEMFSSERACVIPIASAMDDFDEMALLGIDKEDMAAQRF